MKTNKQNPVISLRRHAETERLEDRSKSSTRLITSNGAQSSFTLGEHYKHDTIIQGFSSPTVRASQTLCFIMDGASQFDPYILRFNEKRLNELVISNGYRENIDGMELNRDERVGYFLTHQDQTQTSTTPLNAAQAIANFVASVNHRYQRISRRVEAITHGLKSECFLEILSKGVFVDQLNRTAFDNLEGLELELQRGKYVIRFRNQKISIPESKLNELANSYKAQ